MLVVVLMDRQHRYARVLHAAAVSLGGDDELAVHLGVAPDQLARWRSGVDPVPIEAFLAGLDVIALRRFARKRRVRVAALRERRPQRN